MHLTWVHAVCIETKEYIFCHKVSVQGCMVDCEDIPPETKASAMPPWSLPFTAVLKPFFRFLMNYTTHCLHIFFPSYHVVFFCCCRAIFFLAVCKNIQDSTCCCLRCFPFPDDHLHLVNTLLGLDVLILRFSV